MPIKPNENDTKILRYLYQLRYANIDYLITLTGRKRESLVRRINQLIKEKYIYKKSFYHRNIPFVYMLDKTGFRYLRDIGIIPDEKMPKTIAPQRLTEHFINHELLLSEIQMSLLLTSRESPIKLTKWRQGKELFDSVKVSGIRKKLPVRPDAFFEINLTHLESDKTRLAFVVEADRSTMANKTVMTKYPAYVEYLKQRKHKEFYGVKWFQVLTIALTEKRAESLRKSAKKHIPENYQKHFYFASRGSLNFETPAGIFEPVFRTAKTDELISFIPTRFLGE